MTTTAAGIAVALLAITPSVANAFVTAGAEVFFVATGTVDTEREHTPDDGQPAESSADETSGAGVTVYGLIGALPVVNAGLALHYLPTLEVTDDAKNTSKLGSEFDLNLRVGATLPVPSVVASVHGEGGLTLYSPKGAYADLGEAYDTEDTSSLGYNAGAGLRVGYSITPLVALVAGADYQYYTFEVFSGSRSSAGLGTETEKLTASGTRLKITFGVNFDL
jgi:hypothetical protein